MSMYKSHLNGMARKMAIFDYTMENEMNKISTILEMVDIRANQVHNDIETKIILENGTPDDMAYMFEEANEETVKQKKGIIKKIIDWCKKTFASIKAKIEKITKRSKTVTKGEIGPVKYEITVKLKGDMKDIDEYYRNIQQSLSQMNRGDFISAAASLEGVKEPSSMTTVTESESTTEITEDERDKMVDELEDKSDTIEQVIDSVESKIDNEENVEVVTAATKSLPKLQKLLNAIGRTLSGLAGAVAVKTAVAVNAIEEKFAKKKPAEEAPATESFSDIFDDYSMYF